MPKPPLIPGAQGTGPGLATVSVTLCRVRVKPSSSPGGREAGQLLWVLGQRGLSASLASPRRNGASASLRPLIHPQIPLKMPSLWAVVRVTGQAQCLASSTHFMNGSLAVISSSFSRPFIQQVVSEPDPGACFADFRGRHCPVHSLFQRRPRRVNEQRANGQDCVTVGALVCWVRGQVRVTLGLFQRDLYWRCHLSPDPAEAGLSLRHGSSAWVTRPGRALAGAFLTSFSSSPSHQGSQTRIPPLLFVDAGSGSKGFLAPPPAVCASPLLPEAAGSPCS